MSYENDKLTRAGMEAAIKAGGSVLYKGQTFTSVSQLPSDADLAVTADEKATADADLDKQIATLQARKAKLATASTVPAKDADADAHASHAKHAKK